MGPNTLAHARTSGHHAHAAHMLQTWSGLKKKQTNFPCTRFRPGLHQTSRGRAESEIPPISTRRGAL